VPSRLIGQLIQQVLKETLSLKITNRDVFLEERPDSCDENAPGICQYFMFSATGLDIIRLLLQQQPNAPKALPELYVNFSGKSSIRSNLCVRHRLRSHNLGILERNRKTIFACPGCDSPTFECGCFAGVRIQDSFAYVGK